MNLIIEPPTPKQQLLLKDKHRYVGYGGARGGGKSWAVRVKAVLLCLRFPGIICMIIRRTYPELRENHIRPLRQMLRCDHPNKNERLAKYNDVEKCIIFPNGSRILFRYNDTENDIEKFQGTECDVLFIDEATHQTEESFKKLNACVRRGENNIVGTEDKYPKRTYVTCNPGNRGHDWVKRLFVDRRYNENEDADDYVFYKALVTDNEPLMKSNPEYIKQLESLSPKLRRAWLDGDWDIFEGQFFEDFRIDPDIYTAREYGIKLSAEELREQHRWCHVIPSFDVSKGECRNWNIMRSYDFGYGKPFSCAWWAMDYDGVLYRILELYGCTGEPNEGLKWTPDQQFAEIARIEREHPWLKGRKIDGVADPAIWDASRGESIADTAMKYGVYFTPGDNKRIPGWMQCHYRLQFDENGYSRMYVFDNCKDFIRTIPLLIYDDHKVEDLDTDLEDHIADDWRYMCMSRPITPIKPVPKKVIMSDPLNMFT